MDENQGEPMVWTTRGNMRCADLDYSVERQDEVDQIVLRPTYRDKETGEIVRNDVHVIPLAPWQTGKGGRLEQMALSGAVSSVN